MARKVCASRTWSALRQDDDFAVEVAGLAGVQRRCGLRQWVGTPDGHVEAPLFDERSDLAQSGTEFASRSADMDLDAGEGSVEGDEGQDTFGASCQRDRQRDFTAAGGVKDGVDPRRSDRADAVEKPVTV